MKSAPNAVLEIMNRFQKITDCQPIVLENVKPRQEDNKFFLNKKKKKVSNA